MPSNSLHNDKFGENWIQNLKKHHSKKYLDNNEFDDNFDENPPEEHNFIHL
jgi:hypothetical protein